MKVARIQIDQQMARINIETQNATLKILNPKRAMSINSNDARMNVRSEMGKVELDMTNFKNKMDLKSMRDLTDDFSARAKSKLIQNIKEYSDVSDQIAKLPSTGNKIGQAARSKILKPEMPAMNSGEVPKQPVKMDGKPGKIQINWSKNELVIKWGKYEPPVIIVEPKPSVKIELVQEPEVECEVVEVYIPPETGQSIDTIA
jgi:hypothetical protein